MSHTEAIEDAQITVRSGDRVWTLTTQGGTLTLRDATPPVDRGLLELLRGAFFSPMEKQIVRALAEGPLVAKQIAKEFGWQNPTTSLRLALANLAARGVLTRDGDGYRVADSRFIELAGPAPFSSSRPRNGHPTGVSDHAPVLLGAVPRDA